MVTAAWLKPLRNERPSCHLLSGPPAPLPPATKWYCSARQGTPARLPCMLCLSPPEPLACAPPTPAPPRWRAPASSPPAHSMPPPAGSSPWPTAAQALCTGPRPWPPPGSPSARSSPPPGCSSRCGCRRPARCSAQTARLPLAACRRRRRHCPWPSAPLPAPCRQPPAAPGAAQAATGPALSPGAAPPAGGPAAATSQVKAWVCGPGSETHMAPAGLPRRGQTRRRARRGAVCQRQHGGTTAGSTPLRRCPRASPVRPPAHPPRHLLRRPRRARCPTWQPGPRPQAPPQPPAPACGRAPAGKAEAVAEAWAT